MDLRRSILWVIFTVSVIFLYNSWLQSNGRSGLFGEPATHQTAAVQPQAAGTDVPQASSGAALVDSGKGETTPAAVPVLTTVSTDLMQLQISSEGGTLVRARLLQYPSETDPKSKVLLFNDVAGDTYVAQSGLVGGGFPNHKTPMTLVPGPTTMGNADSLSVTLRSAEVGGLQLERTYTFHRGSYAIDVRNVVHNLGKTPVTPELYLQLVRDGHDPSVGTRFYHTFTGAAVYTSADKFQKFAFKDFKDQVKTISSGDGWLGVVQHYFVSAWLPSAGQRQFYLRRLGADLYASGVVLPLPSLAPGASAARDDKLYVGPEIESQLQALAPGFELVKDYGWVTIIAKPLFWVLEQVHKVIGNWGWSIIALTLLLKLLFFPLTAASYRSMAKMKAVGPRMNALRERYKNDQAGLNAAMVEMYRKEKINPLGGCLPVVIQIPVFIALYWVLLSSVELRGAPWLGWIHDLAMQDPYYVLPLVMTASSFLQVKLNPTPPDPTQAKMMLIMPLAFSVMFFFFPAGLVLYWLTNNLVSIGQQWFINRKMGVPELSMPK